MNIVYMDIPQHQTMADIIQLFIYIYRPYIIQHFIYISRTLYIYNIYIYANIYISMLATCHVARCYVSRIIETWGAGVETQENQKIFVPLSKKDKNKKSNERWT